MAWIDGPPNVGGTGAFLGASGLDGYYVEVDTIMDRGPRCTLVNEPPAPHVALMRTTSSLPGRDFCEATTIAAVQVGEVQSNGFHQLELDFDVTRAGTEALISLDGLQVIAASVPDYMQRTATFGATAGTGSAADTHIVRSLQLRCD